MTAPGTLDGFDHLEQSQRLEVADRFGRFAGFRDGSCTTSDPIPFDR